MSDLNQIHTALNRLFHEEGQRIVFWNDPDREFLNTLPFLELDGVTTLRLDEVGALEAKIRLEREEPNGKFLLYAPTEEPDYEADWLLDIRLYSRSFRADKASILLQELGLVNLHLRTHVSDRRKFFDAKDRLQKIKNLVAPNDAAADLDRKMVTVVAKADQRELFNIVRTTLHAWAQELTTDYPDASDQKNPSDSSVPIHDIRGSNEIELNAPPAVWTQIEKFDLDGGIRGPSTCCFCRSAIRNQVSLRHIRNQCRPTRTLKATTWPSATWLLDASPQKSGTAKSQWLLVFAELCKLSADGGRSFLVLTGRLAPCRFYTNTRREVFAGLPYAAGREAILSACCVLQAPTRVLATGLSPHERVFAT